MHAPPPLIPLCSPKQARLPTSLALGSFDGLHAGHHRVIERITRDSPGVPSVVSFWPHPREVLYGDTRLRLDLPSEKASLLAPLGIEQLILVPFNRSLSALSPEAFFNQILLETLKAKRISIGANFCFGHKRKGNAVTLQKLGESKGIEILVLPILEDATGRISSSRIREALSKGDLNTAKALMGRSYRFRGKVVKGRGIGSGLGWPTANLEVDGRKFLPGLGVYSARAWINNEGAPLSAVMNLGPQPTVDPTSPSALEVHLLNQNRNLEGMELTVEPVQRLRGQQRFKDLSELSEQIGKDAKMAQSSLQSL